MKLKLPFLVLVLALLFVLSSSAGKADLFKAEVFYFTPLECSFSDFMPQFDTSFGDLDPRDENNQPIKTLSAKRNIVTIFRSGLYNLLLYSEIHSIAKALDIIRQKLNLSALAIAKHLPVLINGVTAAIVFNTRLNWDKILICLSGFLAFNILLLKFSIFNLQFAITHNKTAPLILRL